ncbi:MAG: HDIG domain-containing protein [Lentisphaeria bacterium]|nr:HDIG domain-containing protein [Lentisphaeria bacterium]
MTSTGEQPKHSNEQSAPIVSKEGDIEQFKERLRQSCLESLQRSRKDTSWTLRFFTKENIIGTLLFFLVLLSGGFFRILSIQGNTIAERLWTIEFAMFIVVLALFLTFFIAVLNAPWKVLRQVPRLREFSLISLLMVLEFATVWAIDRCEFISTASPGNIITVIPLALFPALLINLLDERTAICTAGLEAILLPLQISNLDSQYNYRLFCFALIIATASVPCFRNIKVRIHYISYGLLMGVFVALCGIALECTFTHDFILEKFIKDIALPGVLQGALTGLACMLLLPLFEMLFHMPTPMTLAELTDVNSPLLQRLRNEAPGTYQHSLDVAELATNAASIIGADAKLVHVMGLYHDVGKLFAPQYFAENMAPGTNPLMNSLLPEESANIIFEHTTHGMQLASKYHLSYLITPAISQHHGNSLLTLFYQKACKEAAEKKLPAPAESKFRYPHTPTSSREVAILSLADSCEAAVRALLSTKTDLNQLAQKLVETSESAGKNATAKCAALLESTLTQKDKAAIARSIDERIASVFQSRFTDHQLDNVDITTRELSQIAVSFRETILFHFHTRPEYRIK